MSINITKRTTTKLIINKDNKRKETSYFSENLMNIILKYLEKVTNPWICINEIIKDILNEEIDLYYLTLLYDGINQYEDEFKFKDTNQWKMDKWKELNQLVYITFNGGSISELEEDF